MKPIKISRPRWLLGALGAAVATGAVSCTAKVVDGLSPPPGPPTTAPAALLVISGDQQRGPVGTLLGQPLVVQVADSTGVPYPGVPVSWAATAGGGGLTQAELVTDSFGNAHAGWVLGSDVGTQTVTVSSPSLPDVTFTATATALPLGVEVLPSQITLVTGDSQQFSGQGIFSGGVRNRIPLTWTATGGQVTSQGLYRAGSTPGAFRVIARQSGGTLADTAVVSLVAPTATLQQIVLTPATVRIAVGTTQQFSVTGIMSDGSQIVPSVTYSATGGTVSPDGLYTATAVGSFRVIAVQNGGALADTATVTNTSPPPPPPPGQVTVLFHSDWSTATGTSDAALRDTNKQLPWMERWGDNGLLTVVSAAGLGFPSGMQNAFRVMHYQQSFDWVQNNDLWQPPAIGSSLYFRVYFRNTISNDVDGGGQYASTHPLESTGVPGGLGGNFYAFHYASYPDGTFPFLIAMGAAPFPYSGWTPGAPSSTHGGRNYDPATLVKNTTYRLEWKLTRTAANRYSYDMRIYGGDDKTLLFDSSSIYAWTGNTSQTLAAFGVNLPIDDNRVTDLRIGINGGFATARPEYVYWGGLAVCSGDWCGAYNGTY